MSKILIVNGPNLNLLGTRETHIYGSETLNDINQALIEKGKSYNLEVLPFQSNHEGEIVDFIQKEGLSAAGMIINPAAFTHTSVAIRDAILARDLKFIEVHLSNIYKRESFRQHSYYHDKAEGVIMGLGSKGYFLALEAMAELIKNYI